MVHTRGTSGSLGAVVILFMLAAGISPAVMPTQLVRKVVILHSYIPGEWYHGLNRGVEETLGKLGVATELVPIIYDSEYWGDKPPVLKEKEKRRILAQIRAFSPNLVIVCDDEASDTFIPELMRSEVPVVFTGVNRSEGELPWLTGAPKTLLSGVVELYPVREFASVLTRLLPNLRKLSILSSKKPSSQFVSKSTANTMLSSDFEREFKIRLQSVNLHAHWEEWKEKALTLNEKNSAVWVLVPYDVRDTNNIQVPLPQMGRWFRKHLRVPYIGMSVVHTKMGGLMSVQITPFDLGRQAAEIAGRFFQGVPLANLPIEKARYHQIEINVSEAKRLGVKIPKELYGVAKMVEEPFLQYGR